MADEYTPTDEDMEDRYVRHSLSLMDFPRGDREWWTEKLRAEFRRGLARVRRAAKAEALREAADYIDGEEPKHLGDLDLDPLDYNTGGEYGIDCAAAWLRMHADRYEQEGNHA